MLRDPHRIDDRGGLHRSIDPRRLSELVRGNRRNLLHSLRRVGLDDLLEFLEVVSTLLDERLILQTFTQNDVHHPIHPRDIRPVLLAQPQSGVIHKIYSSWINNDQLCSMVTHCSFDQICYHWVRFSSVRTSNQNTLRVFQLSH